MHLSYITQPWLDDLVLAHIEHAKNVIERGVTDYIPELILHEDVEGETKTTLCLLDGLINPGDYGPMQLLGQKFARERMNICAVTLATDVWVSPPVSPSSPRIAPSMHPERREGVMVVGYTITHLRAASVIFYSRSPDTNHMRLESTDPIGSGRIGNQYLNHFMGGYARAYMQHLFAKYN